MLEVVNYAIEWFICLYKYVVCHPRNVKREDRRCSTSQSSQSVVHVLNINGLDMYPGDSEQRTSE